MAAIAFPDSPVDDQEFEAPNGVTYQWDETNQRWEVAEGSGGSSDGSYLPLTGGSMTGDINMLDGSHLNVRGSATGYGRIYWYAPWDSDQINIEMGCEGFFRYITPLDSGIQFSIVDPQGTAHSENYLLAVHRDNYGGANVTDASVNYYGKIEKDEEIVNKKFVDDAIGGIDVSDQIEDKLSKSGDKANGNYDFDGDCLIRVNGDLVVKARSASIGGSNVFAIYGSQDRVQYWGKIDDDHCVVTKEYVDDAVGSSGTGIEDVGTSAPPAERPRGSMVLSNDKLFYYV